MPRNGVERIQYEISEGDASGGNARLAAPAGEHRCQRAKAGWHAAHLSPRQPRQHVDPRRGHDFGRGADHAHFNNLVLFNQHEKQNRLDNIVPDLAESWSWSEDGNDLTFKLHQGVNWHDGKRFTAADVKCTWDLLQGKAKEKLRLNAREAWWANLDN